MSKGRFRSHLESTIAQQLDDEGIPYKYEDYSYEYDLPLPRAECADCGSKNVATTRWYTPDFFLPNGIVIETKGKLDRATRKKMIAVRKAHPDEDIRFLFQRNNKIDKRSTTRYMDWAAQHGFKAALRQIPDEWLAEARSDDEDIDAGH